LFRYYLVFDDENEHKITTGAVVTLTVHLHRENMSNLFTKDSPSNTLDDEINEEQIDDKENRDKVSKYIFFSFLNLFID
jgi:hypothetical protein